MRITIEYFGRDSKSKMNSIRHANYMVEEILVEYLADQNSMKRLLFDLSFSATDSLQWRDRNGELILLHREIYDSQGSKSKEWWYLHELRFGQALSPHDLSSLRLILPKGVPKGYCMIEVFGHSAKVSREFPYVLVSGTEQLDVKNAALMVKDVLLRHQGQLPGKPTEGGGGEVVETNVLGNENASVGVCGLRVDGEDSNVKTVQGADKEVNGAEVPPHAPSAELYASVKGATSFRWEPPPPSPQKRGSGSKPEDRPTKVAKKEVEIRGRPRSRKRPRSRPRNRRKKKGEENNRALTLWAAEVADI